MHDIRQDKQEVLLKIATDELNSTQVRLLKTVTSLMASVLTADDESEYFQTSSELMKKIAEVINHADFANKNKKIPYGNQAVEFAIDFIKEHLEQNQIHNIDN